MLFTTAARRFPFVAVAILALVAGIDAACAPATAPTLPPASNSARATAALPPASAQSNLPSATSALPLPPAKPGLSVEPGTTRITADWDAVAGATSYEVRWRPRRGDFPAGNLATVTDSDATFDVLEQGLWVVRVQACNDGGCSGPATATVPVIINIDGHHAVRMWFSYDPEEEGKPLTINAIHLDWDPLPGHYIVKYRLTNNDPNQWITSEPLSEPGYTLTEDSVAEFKNGGLPIIRVFFNCDENRRGCALLGRVPNTTVEEIREIAPADPYAGRSEGAGGAAGARSSYLPAGQERDPVTHMLRPASDFTITTETRDGTSYRCVSRSAENAWEEGLFGSADDAVQSCTATTRLNHYRYDPDAVFPGGETCGERPTETELERRIFGDVMKVCNEHPDDPSSRGITPTGRISGQSHSVHHRVDHYGLLTWPKWLRAA